MLVDLGELGSWWGCRWLLLLSWWFCRVVDGRVGFVGCLGVQGGGFCRVLGVAGGEGGERGAGAGAGDVGGGGWGGDELMVLVGCGCLLMWLV